MFSHTKSYRNLQYQVNTNLFSMTNSKLGLPVVYSQFIPLVSDGNQVVMRDPELHFELFCE